MSEIFSPRKRTSMKDRGSIVVSSPYFSTLGTSTVASVTSTSPEDLVVTHVSFAITFVSRLFSFDWDVDDPPTSEYVSSGLGKQTNCSSLPKTEPGF